MDKEIRKIKKLTHFMQKQGVLHLKTPDFELSLSPQSLFPEKKSMEAEIPTEEPKPEFTDEDLLLWSAPGAH